MKVSDVMSRDVLVASPTQSIRDAAEMMAKIDVGVLPVGENDRLDRHDHGPRHCDTRSGGRESPDHEGARCHE
jgi:CBS domain-containing protein